MIYISDVVPLQDGTLVHLKFVESIRTEVNSQLLAIGALKDNHLFEIRTVGGMVHIASTQYISTTKKLKCTHVELIQAICDKWVRINKMEL